MYANSVQFNVTQLDFVMPITQSFILYLQADFELLRDINEDEHDVIDHVNNMDEEPIKRQEV